MKHNIQANDLFKSKSISKINDLFIIPFEANDSDDYYSSLYWNGGGVFEFSANIQVMSASYIFNGGYVVVKKMDPSLVETIAIFDPDSGQNIVITF